MFEKQKKCELARQKKSRKAVNMKNASFDIAPPLYQPPLASMPFLRNTQQQHAKAIFL